MKLLQRIGLRFISKANRPRAEAESREWIATCRGCGLRTSIWDLGGIRYKFHGSPNVAVRCRRCGRRGMQDTVRGQ